MNVFELLLWGALAALVFLLARWVSGQTGLQVWLVFVAALAIAVAVLELVGRVRARRRSSHGGD